MELMNDKVGAHLEVGDTVLYCKAGYNHSIKIMVGKIIAFNAATVKVIMTNIDLGKKPKAIESNVASTSLIQVNDLESASLEWLKEHMND